MIFRDVSGLVGATVTVPIERAPTNKKEDRKEENDIASHTCSSETPIHIYTGFLL